MTGGGDPVLDLAERLNAQAPLKLWSVLVTCLGDASRSGTTEMSGRALSRLVERLGLQPQAMRVALHRLKRDGWIESRREGRVGYHGLSQSAQRQSAAVEARIYGTAQRQVPWHIVGLPPDATDGLALLPEDLDAVAISRSFALISGALGEVPEDWLLATPKGGRLPPWVREIVAEAACEDGFAALQAVLPDQGGLPHDPLDRFALRVLVVHGWRRLILRSNPAAEAALGDGRAEGPCRTAVHGILEQLDPPDGGWLQEVS